MSFIRKAILSNRLQRMAFSYANKLLLVNRKQVKEVGWITYGSWWALRGGLWVSGHFFLFPEKYRAFSMAFFHLAADKFDDVTLAFEKAARLGFPSLDVVLNGVARQQLVFQNYEFSQKLLIFAFGLNQKNANVVYNLGLSYLVLRKPETASLFIAKAISLEKRYAMAHQNIAARCQPKNWQPKDFDLIDDDDIHLYDAYHFIGQLLINAGDARLGIEMFGCAMEAQSRLANKYTVPEKMIEQLHQLNGYDPTKPLRILPYEWVTQIGHLGMIDALIKMQHLGLRPRANLVLLAPHARVANVEFLKCFKDYLVVIDDQELIDNLFPYQRVCGEQFNCYVNGQGEVFDWSDIAAKAFIEWDKRGLGPLIKADTEVIQFGETQMTALGLPKNAWFVALHIRSSGYYREEGSFIQKHRNAQLNSYYPAIKRIHEAGGWVVRMGDPSMPPLKTMPMTIDIACSPYRSRLLDVYLWSQARFFLGTTSGPTNAVISFHTPALLVNCVSNYAQSWNSRVMFVLKPFWSKAHGRYLKIREIFTPEFRGKMFNVNSLAGEGIYPKSNTAKDILVATEEMLDYLNGNGLPAMQTPEPIGADCHELWLWGNAHPSKRFFEKNRRIFLD